MRIALMINTLTNRTCNMSITSESFEEERILKSLSTLFKIGGYIRIDIANKASLSALIALFY